MGITITNIDIPDVFQDLFNEDLRYICYYGGRASAKSWSIAQALIIRSLKKPLRILCTREIEKTVDASLIKLLKDQIKLMNLEDEFYMTDKFIRGNNGSEFLFTGLKADRVSGIQSFEGIDIVWIEEGQTISQLSLDVLFPTIRKAGSQIIISFNPKYDTDPIYVEFVIEQRRRRCVSKKVTFRDNPWFIETALYDEMIFDKEYNYDKYLWVWEGECLKISDAAVFKDKIIVKRFELPNDSAYYMGADFGYSIDPYVLIRCHINQDKRLIYIDKAKREYKLEIDDTEAWMESFLPDIKRHKIIADSARPELISYLKKRNFNIISSKKGSVMEGIEFIRNYTIVIHEDLKDVQNEFKNYTYIIDKLTGKIKYPVDVIKTNNHFIDALRYSLEDVRNPIYETTIF